jgi:acetyltransferase-like isoleucine patch superfamily enzyme
VTWLSVILSFFPALVVFLGILSFLWLCIQPSVLGILALRLVPSLFSLWLRLWGAKVGRGVYWTSKLEIGDRSLLDIGDGVIFGHGVGIYSHAIKPKKDNLMLYVKKVTIGDRAFISGGCRLGPGVEIKAGAYLPVTTDLYPNQKWNV